MSVTNGKIKFANLAATQFIEIAPPVFGYRTMIEFPFTIGETDDNQRFIYDEGESFDMRSCEGDVILPISEQAAFNDLFRQPAASSGVRGQVITMELPTNSGFFPFGPDKGDAGLFTVIVEIVAFPTFGDVPFRYFKSRIKITTVSTTRGVPVSYPSYSLPAVVSEGGFTIGTVAGNRYPTSAFDNKGSEYGDFKTVTEGNIAYPVDRSQNADTWEAKFQMISNQPNAAAVIKYLSGTARGNAFSIAGDPDGNYYIFGKDKASVGAFTVKLTQESIEIIHENYDRFSYNLNLVYVSGT